MKKWILLLWISAVPMLLYAQQNKVTPYVNPFIGTAGTGHTFPGATLPMGLVQLSPETGYAGWEYCSGYRYEDSAILGFSHTHLSGTGALDLGDILLMPFTGSPRRETYKSKFSHSKEQAAAGYYAVALKDNEVHAALTVTQHAGFHQYQYQGNKQANLLLDLRHGLVGKSPGRLEQHVVSSEMKIEDPHTITGYTRTKGWAGDKYVYFIIRLRQPIHSQTWLSDSTEKRNQRIVLSFPNLPARQQLVKVGISTVSVANARENLDAEIKDWNFETTKAAADQTWESYLSKIQVEGTAKQKTTFYTALYHSLIAPNNIADVNGQYRGADNQVYIASNKAYYSTLSLWDTYRALKPLYTILYPGKSNDIVASMLAHHQVAGFLPIWTLWGHENYCMIGNHAIPVIVDAYLKGIRNYDVSKAYEAIKISSTINHKNSRWDLYMKYGYLPSDSVRVEAVSTTLESGYDDWCVAQMAKALGKKADYELFSRRAAFYKNLFNPATGLMRGRTSTGAWVKPFDPLKISHASSAGGDYTEGNAWHYTWHVQQDVDGLIQLMGGKEAFIRKLDSLFAMDSRVYGDGATVDVSGLIGQYVQGNEPSHHVAYLYTLAGKPAKTQEKVHTIVNTLYSDAPDGLSGNDDCGQMSAWYIFSTLGFYPVNPASGQYVFGTPAFSKAVLQVGSKTFTVKALNYAPGNKYIKSIKLNGKEYKLPYITHADIMRGGVLEFVMEKDTAAITKADPLLPYLHSKPAAVTVLNAVEDSVKVKRFTFASRNSANTIYGTIVSPKGNGTYPALLMLHGGGSCADEVGRLQRRFAAKGYVVMAVDLPGICNPDKASLSTGAWRYRPKGIDSRLDISKGIDSSTLVDAIAAGLQGFNLLTTEANVDTNRIGITGFSWGGYMTTMLSSLLSQRVKAAYSVFGSGFFDRGSLWKAQLDTMQENKRNEWLTFFDAGRRAPGMRCPYFVEATVNDRFFWPEAVAATLDTLKVEKNLLWSPNLDHVRPKTAEQMQLSYFNYYLKSEGKPFGKVRIDKTMPAANNGRELFISVTMPQGITADSVLIYYSEKKSESRNRQWTAIPVAKAPGTGYRVTIPGELLARGIDYYVYVTDSRNTSVSTAIQM